MAGAVAGLMASLGGINVIRTYTSGSGSTSIPTGASYVIIEVYGGGGAGGTGSNLCVGLAGGVGGNGGYVKKTLALTGANVGQTFNYVVGPGGTVAAGTASTATNGTFPTSVSMSGGGGGRGVNGASGGAAGTPGTASGGDVNTAGGGSAGGSGGPVPNGTGGAGSNGIVRFTFH